MRLYLNENISRREAAVLRTSGHDVVAVNEHPPLQGLPDVAHARIADDQGRVLITKDGDYGDLRVREGIPEVGVVYVKPDANTPDLADRLPGILERHRESLSRGAFVTVDRARERVREAAGPSGRG